MVYLRLLGHSEVCLQGNSFKSSRVKFGLPHAYNFGL